MKVQLKKILCFGLVNSYCSDIILLPNANVYCTCFQLEHITKVILYTVSTTSHTQPYIAARVKVMQNMAKQSSATADFLSKWFKHLLFKSRHVQHICAHLSAKFDKLHIIVFC